MVASAFPTLDFDDPPTEIVPDAVFIWNGSGWSHYAWTGGERSNQIICMGNTFVLDTPDFAPWLPHILVPHNVAGEVVLVPEPTWAPGTMWVGCGLGTVAGAPACPADYHGTLEITANGALRTDYEQYYLNDDWQWSELIIGGGWSPSTGTVINRGLITQLNEINIKNGSLQVYDGGHVDSNYMLLGIYGGNGLLHIDAPTGQVTAHSFYLGYGGGGTVELLNGEFTAVHFQTGRRGTNLAGDSGIFNQQGGISHLGDVDLYSNQVTGGQINVSGGQCHAQSLTVAGFSSNSIVSQSGGSIAVVETVVVGGTGVPQYDTGGSLEISGGQFTSNNIQLGGSISANCLLSGNSVTGITSLIEVGRSAGTIGNLEIQGSAALTCAGLSVRYGNQAYQNGSGSEVTVGGLTVHGGGYHLWNGTVHNAGTTRIGSADGVAALFDHSAGTITGGVMRIEASNGGTATYTLEGTGEASFGNIWLGGDGTGTLTIQHDLAVMTADNLYLTSVAGSHGTLNLTDGFLDLTSISCGLGNAVINQSGGWLTATTVDATRADGTPGYTLTGGILNAATLSGVNLTGGGVNAGQIQVVTGEQSNGTTALSANSVTASTQLDVLRLNLGIDNQPSTSVISQLDQTLWVRGNMSVGVQRQASSSHNGSLHVAGNLVLTNNSHLYTLSAVAPVNVAGATRIGLDASASGIILHGPLTTATLELGANAAFLDSSTDAAGTLALHNLTSPDNAVNLDWHSPILVGLAGQAQAGLVPMDGGQLAATQMTVGNLGPATFNHAGGTVQLAGSLDLGLAGCTGTYTLGGTGLLFAHDLLIGKLGGGHFQQTGGWAQIGATLVVGKEAGSNGDYLLSGGNLDAPVMEIGAAGTGGMSQSGGRVRAMGSVSLATLAGSTGSYQVSDDASLQIGALNVGVHGAGSFVMDLSGGSLEVGTALGIGTGSGGSGVVTLRNGTLDAPNATVTLGGGTSGKLTFAGGLIGDPSSRTLVANVLNFGVGGVLESSGFNNTLRINEMINRPNVFSFSGVLEIGQMAGTGNIALTQSEQLSATLVAVGCGGEGTISLSGSAVLTTNVLEVGYEGPGHIAQGGGTVNVLDEIDLGLGWSPGDYVLTAGALQAGDAVMKVGVSNTGGFTISGGTVTTSGIEVGCGTGLGTFAINGGLVGTQSFTVGSNGAVTSIGTVGELRTNSLTFAGSALDLTGALAIGHTGGTGNVVLAAGRQLTSATLVIGHNAVGSYTQNGGTTRATSTLKLGNEAAGQGTLTLNAGVLDTANTVIGKQGVGELINSGGTHQGNTSFTLGDLAGSSGTYRLSGTGSLSATSGFVGNAGNGLFVQGGGTHTASSLNLAGSANVSGEYRLNSGDLVLSSGCYVGYRGTGQITQSGGTSQALALYMGYLAGSSGTYTMTGGSLAAGTQYVGYNGTGRFVQSGGSNTHATANLYVGRSTNGNGTYELSGTGVLGVNYEDIGYGSPGSFLQSGGTHTVAGALTLGSSSGKSGSFNLSGGTLSSWGIYVGNSGTGLFQQSAGSVSVTSTISIGVNTSGIGTMEISGGSLNVKNLNLPLNGTGTLRILNSAAAITVGTRLTIGTKGTFTAVPGTTIHMTGSIFENKSTDATKLAGLASTTLIFEGGPSVLDTFEVAGRDYGAVESGFTQNFALENLTIGGMAVGRVKLVDVNDNQPTWTGKEALYVNNLVVNPGSTLDLNGFKIYYHHFTGNLTDVLFNGGSLVQIMTDYGTWAAGFAGFTDTAAGSDPDHDGLTNRNEYAFGLNPTSGSSCNPITSGLQTDGKFSYTRRTPSLTGLSYTVWTSTNLQTWVKDVGASQVAGAPDANHVEAVAVTLTAAPSNGRLFARVQAE